MHLLDIIRRDPIRPMLLKDTVGLTLSELADAIKLTAGIAAALPQKSAYSLRAAESR